MKFVTRYWPIALLSTIFGLFFVVNIVDDSSVNIIPLIDGIPHSSIFSDSVFWFTLGFLAVVGFCFHLIWANVKSSEFDKPLPDTVITFTGASGMTIAICSFSLSVFYGFSMGGGHGLLPIVFAVIFGSISVAEFTSAYWVSHWLHTRNALLYTVAISLMLVGIGTSIIAGQALIAGQIDKVKQDRLVASDTYQSALKARENAQAKVQQLATSKSEFDAAKSTYNGLNSKAQGIISLNSAYSQCSNFPVSLCSAKTASSGGSYRTRNNKTNAALAPIRDGMLSAKKVINQYQQYLAAQDVADTLLAKPLPKGASVELPHVKWLSAVTGMHPDLVEARLYLSLAIIAELTGLILLFFYGKGTRPIGFNTGFNPARVSPVPALDTGGYVLEEGYAYIHEDEIVLTKEQSREWLQYLANKGKTEPPTQSSPQDTPKQVIKIEGQRVPPELSGKTGKGRMGLIDSCVECGNDFVVKTWNNVHCCSDCSAKSKGYENSVDRWQAVKLAKRNKK